MDIARLKLYKTQPPIWGIMYRREAAFSVQATREYTQKAAPHPYNTLLHQPTFMPLPPSSAEKQLQPQVLILYTFTGKPSAPAAAEAAARSALPLYRGIQPATLNHPTTFTYTLGLQPAAFIYTLCHVHCVRRTPSDATLFTLSIKHCSPGMTRGLIIHTSL